MTGIVLVIALPILFVIVATYTVLRFAVLLIRLMFLPAALVLVLRRLR